MPLKAAGEPDTPEESVRRVTSVPSLPLSRTSSPLSLPATIHAPAASPVVSATAPYSAMGEDRVGAFSA